MNALQTQDDARKSCLVEEEIHVGQIVTSAANDQQSHRLLLSGILEGKAAGCIH